MFQERFLKKKRSGWVPRWSEGSRTRTATSTSSTTPSTACLYTIFQRQIDLKRFPRDTRWSRCSRTPSATSSSSTMGSSASTTYVHQKLIWHMFIYYFSKINQFKLVHRWSLCFWTPSSSTMASTASTKYVNQKLTCKCLICYFKKTNRFKTVPASYRVIKRLLDTLSELVKLNHEDYSMYQLCSPKIDMAHVDIL